VVLFCSAKWYTFAPPFTSFRDRFDILLEKRPSGLAELGYKILCGKSQFIEGIEDEGMQYPGWRLCGHVG
jgi:hypothetical protein